jgi:hypothetical protein
MEALIKCGLLRARTEVNEWIMLSDKKVLMLPDGYVVSFVPFHECNLVVPPH